MGVKAQGARKRILAGVAAYFSIEYNPQNKEESKQECAEDYGTIEWKVTGDLLQQFKNAKHKSEFLSPEFKTIDGSKWRIQFYPRGYNSPEDCSVYLECVALPSNKASIGVNYSLEVVEVNWTTDGAKTSKKGSEYGKGKAFKRETLNDLVALTIKGRVEETMDVAHGNPCVEWHVSNHWLDQWKNAAYKAVFRSPIFHAVGSEWQLVVNPNGLATEGAANLEVWYQSDESDKKEMNLGYYVDIVALEHSQMNLDGKTVAKKDKYITLSSPFQFSDIQTQSELTICVRLWEKESMDEHEARFLSNLYSHNHKKLPNEWREYFVTETNRVTTLLSGLNLPQYVAIFQENEYKTTQQLRGLTHDDLKAINISVDGHRKAILDEISACFSDSIDQNQMIVSYNGRMEWRVTGDVFQQFKDAIVHQKCVSSKFKTNDGSVWRIRFYPRGDALYSDCSIYLDCVALGANRSHIGVNYSFHIAEADWSYDGAHTFRNEDDTSGLSKAFQSHTLNGLMAMTIQCVVEETMDVSRSNPYFDWKMSNNLVQKCKDARHKALFRSPSFNAIGGEWHLRLYPNGRSTKGIAELDILCESIEANDIIMNVCQYVDLIALEYCQIHLNGNTIKAGDWFTFGSPFKLNNIQKESELTISVKLWKKEKMDRYEARFVSDSYLNTMQLPKEWKQYSMSRDHEISRFLAILELTKYAPQFTENEFGTMEDIKTITTDDLKEIDVKLGARKRIMMKLVAYFRDFEEYKQNDADANSKTKTSANHYFNALVICIAIAKYNSALLDDLDTAKDLAMYKALFEKLYNYTLLANDPSKPMNPKDMTKFLRNARNQHLYDFKEDKLKYDSLIVTFGGHGTYDSVICSNGSTYKHKEIRDIFKLKELKDIPKIFIFDACRTDDDHGDDEKQKGRSVNTAATFSSTLMTSEGHKVYGAKICKYVTQEFKRMHRNKEFKPFGKVYRAARANILEETNKEQNLVLCEHDPDIDDIVFVPRDKARGTKRKRHDANTRQAAPIDSLGRFLRNIELDCYYKELKEKGFDNKAMLSDIDEDTLELMHITSQSHRFAILKAVKTLNNPSH
eukprot:579582_1